MSILAKVRTRSLSLFARAISGPLRLAELPALRRYALRSLTHQPTFIIGAPRSGSTILYQALTNAYDVAYFDNVACTFHRNPLAGFALSRAMFDNRPHDSFTSTHGTTSGGHAPSECGGFWYRWLPRNRHFVDDMDVSDETVRQIRAEISALTNHARKPLLFKNMNAGQRLRLLRRCFPDAKFIYIKRDPVFVVDSILRVRAARRTPSHQLWSIRPRGYEELLDLPEIEMVAHQVTRIELQIEQDAGLFAPSNFRRIRYSELSSELVASLAAFIGARLRPGGRLPEFRMDQFVSRDSARWSEIERALDAAREAVDDPSRAP